MTAFLGLALALASARAAVFPPGGLIYSTAPACPPGFRAYDKMDGFVLLSTSDEGVAGQRNGKAPLGPGEQRTHSHYLPGGGACMLGSTDAVAVECDPLLTHPELAVKASTAPAPYPTPICNAPSTAGFVPSGDTGYGFLQMRMCERDGTGPDFHVEGNAVWFAALPDTTSPTASMGMPTPSPSYVKTCGEDGWYFTIGDGRTIVALQDSLPSAVRSNGTKINFGAYPALSHTHAINSYVNFSVPFVSVSAPPSPTACTKSAVPSAQPVVPVVGSLSTEGLNLPFMWAVTCNAQNSNTSPTSQDMPPGTVLFFNDVKCPSSWLPAPDLHAGRLIVAQSAGKAVFGSANPLRTATESGTGPDAHSHTSLTGAKIVLPPSPNHHFNIHPSPAPPRFNVIASTPTGREFEIQPKFTGGAAGNVVIPYLAIRLCRKENNSTSAPTLSADEAAARTAMITGAILGTLAGIGLLTFAVMWARRRRMLHQGSRKTDGTGDGAPVLFSPKGSGSLLTATAQSGAGGGGGKGLKAGGGVIMSNKTKFSSMAHPAARFVDPKRAGGAPIGPDRRNSGVSADVEEPGIPVVAAEDDPPIVDAVAVPLRRVHATEDFDADSRDEVSLVKGDAVDVLKEHGQWLVVKNVRTGATGMVPKEYVSS